MTAASTICLLLLSSHASICTPQLNRAEFEDQDDDIRVQYEGFRPGMYLRIEVENMPCEFVVNFDPHYPMILGGLGNSEGNVGYIQVKLFQFTVTPCVFLFVSTCIFIDLCVNICTKFHNRVRLKKRCPPPKIRLEPFKP